MRGVFFIVGPTAVGKSALAVDVAEENDAEIVSADAYQIYRGLAVLTASPDEKLQQRVPHHLLGTVPVTETMSAAKFRELALHTLADIESRCKNAIVVGGSGLYLKAIMTGFTDTAPPNFALREELSGLSARELAERLCRIDPERAAKVDLQNPRRIMRALEITKTAPATISLSCRAKTRDPVGVAGTGVLLVRERDDLYHRISDRVNAMFHDGVKEEVRNATKVGATAARTLGYGPIGQVNAGAISETEAIAQIQQATRRYAKRQLTWFRHQTNFPHLNLTALSHQEAARTITLMARRQFGQG